jgi:hypothetical protein
METKRTLKMAFAGLGAAALLVTAAGAASAESNGTHQNNYNKLRTEVLHGDNSPSSCGSLSWQDVGANGDDSPIDANDRALVAEVCDGDYSDAFSNNSLNINRPVGSVKNISFDYRTSTIVGAGEVYIGAVLSTGDVLYLDAAHCNRPIAVSSTWSRSDFTGTTALDACTIYENGAVPYSSDGTHSALQVYGSSHPGVEISYTFIGFFDFPDTDPSHTYVVDRVGLGTNRIYNYSNTRAFGCSFNESRC